MNCWKWKQRHRGERGNFADSPIRRFAVSPLLSKMAFARTTALELLRRAYEQNRLAHAYLITGAPGSGKEALQPN